jgi:hypothetical protein
MAVSYIAPTAQGAADGTSASNAWGFASLTSAESQAGDGGTVYFVDGTYSIVGGIHWNNYDRDITYQSLNPQGAFLLGALGTVGKRFDIGKSASFTTAIKGFKVENLYYILRSTLQMESVSQVDTVSPTNWQYGLMYSLVGAPHKISYCSFAINYSAAGNDEFIAASWTAQSKFINCSFYLHLDNPATNIVGVPSMKWESCIFASNGIGTIASSAVRIADCSNCCLFNFYHTSGGTNNIFTNPFFVAGATGNLRLRPSSPCIGAGSGDLPPAGVAGDYYFAVLQQGIGDGSDADNAEAFSPANLATAEAAANSLSTIYFLPGTYTLGAALTFNATTAPGLTYQSTEPNKAILDCSVVLRAFYFNQTATLKDFSTKNCWFSVLTEYTTVTFVGLQHEQTFATNYGAPFNSLFHSYGGAPNSKALILKECSFALEFSGTAILIKMSGHTFSAENCAFHAKASSVSAGGITTSGTSAFWTVKNTIFTSDNSSAFGLSLAALSTSSCFYQFGSNNTSGGTNNIFVDPQFVGASTGNFTLRPTSPCIGASSGTSTSSFVYIRPGTGTATTAPGTLADPYYYSELATAETAAGSGGTILFTDGSYDSASNISTSTTLGITYQSVNPLEAIINNTNSSTNAAFVISNCTDTTNAPGFKDLKFIDCGIQHYGPIFTFANSFKVEGCHFKYESRNFQGTGFFYNGNNRIDRIYNNFFEAVTPLGGTNWLYSNTNTDFKGNTVFLNASTGTYGIGAAMSGAKNNIFYATDAATIAAYNIAINGSNNLFYQWGTGQSGGTDNIIGQDPLFVDIANRNIQLRPSSPCIGKGT